MKALVSAASKHGATAEIAERIAHTLAARRIDASVLAPEDVTSIDGYDIVVLGSAVYMGHWMESMREFVDRNESTFGGRSVWLFSSGPIGEPPMPKEEAVDVANIMRKTAAREHRVFAGRLLRHGLTFPERAIVIALRVPSGDYRDWKAITDWATNIADTAQREHRRGS